MAESKIVRKCFINSKLKNEIKIVLKNCVAKCELN